MPISRIDQSDLDAIKAQSDIVDVISSYLPLDKKGKEYVGVCPFHDDHDPSMRVSPQKQIYKCFVCGQGGNVFNFISKIENVSFTEAVQKAAQRIGYPLKAAAAATVRQDPHQQAYDALNQFVEYCNYNLYSQQGASALAYLRSRKFSDEVIRQYRIGYAPDAAQIRRFFQAKNLSPRVLLEAGLILDNESLDQPMFHERIIIPILNSESKIAGITARTLLQDKNVPKYLNTGNTPVFEKGSILFNYPFAREAARKSGRLVLCEGAMDVLGLAKAGIHEGIAAMGTAMTNRQLSLISRLRVPVNVFYDSDRAGQDAAYKFGKLALQAGIPFSIVCKTELKDPDEIFIQKGPQAVQAALSRTQSFVEFCFDYLQSRYDLQNYEDKSEYAKAMASLIETGAGEHEKEGFYDRLQKLTGFDYSAKNRSVLPLRKKKKHETFVSVPEIEAGREAAERNVLCAMLYSYGFVEAFKDEIGYFSDPVCQDLSLYIYEAYRHNAQIDPLGLMDAIEDEKVRNLLVDLFSMDASQTATEHNFYDAMSKIRESALSEQSRQMTKKVIGSLDRDEMLARIAEKRKLVAMKNQRRERKEDE
ncbi:MAG: DNA primase [Erysipelotrichaceae bacterium]|nr:DNA primase [Erysipelotrichaceae bacterium]